MANGSTFTTTRNACKLCAPLGACLALRGVESTIPLVHGSQGCSTYIRRYLIGHFREPIDIASSSFDEESTVFGGEKNLHEALRNITSQYSPRLIGVASSCLSETIGDDVKMFLKRYQNTHAGEALPRLVFISTPSYKGTHAEGYHATVRALVETLVEGKKSSEESPPLPPLVNLLPGMVSPADLRHLKEILAAFGLSSVILPDYSDTLDAPARAEILPIPEGGTPLAAIAGMGRARATIALGVCVRPEDAAEVFLQESCGVPSHRISLPIGVRETDRFFSLLTGISGRQIPAAFDLERGRLIDAYVDGHKIIFGKKIVVYGEEDLVVGLASLVGECGGIPILCASGGQSGRMKEEILARLPSLAGRIQISAGLDHLEIKELCRAMKPDLLLGSSKGYSIARELNIPLVRAGFPVHDRIGSQRIAHLGYRGSQELFDRIINALLERQQDSSPVGYGTY